jgi:polyhydroxyalkanoate synthesis repressor PhaR
MVSERIIKKYPNRRLYDTQLSRYITVADVRDLVMQGVPVRVMDSTNDVDITRSILLQIMLDEEAGDEPLFTAPMLAQIIRFYGGTLQRLFARYLENSLDLFTRQQQQLAESWRETPFDTVTRMTQRNMDLWSDMQAEMLRAAGFPLGRRKPPAPNPDEDDGSGG